MTDRIVRTQDALNDYRDIWRYIARENPTATDNLLRRFDDVLELLADAPGLGTPRPDLGPFIRSKAVGNYLLFYEATDAGVQLARVLHGARNIARVYHEPT